MLGIEDDLNLYAYVKNDPLDKTDPTGQTCNGELTECLADIPKDAEVKDPSKNVQNSPDDDKAMRQHKGDVQVKHGKDEKIGFIEKDGSFRNPSDAQAGHTGTGDNTRANVIPDDISVIHGHTPLDNGVVDDTQQGVGLGDIQPLTTGRTNRTVTPDGRLGVHEIVNGRLVFRMIDGKMTKSEVEGHPGQFKYRATALGSLNAPQQDDLWYARLCGRTAARCC